MGWQFAAVGAGAALGAWLRWGLSIWLNPRTGQWPLGTLASNLIGGFLVGVAVAFFAAKPGIGVEWRLLAITGFLGGLTTFSTFSAEVVELFLRGAYPAAVGLAALHLLGSLLLTLLGLVSFRVFAS